MPQSGRSAEKQCHMGQRARRESNPDLLINVLEYWQIELAGGYSDMMNFLEQIKNDGPRTFPIALTMKASDSGDGIHTWSVVFVV